MDIVRGLAIFCEDIREERTGQDTLIGIMADNIAVPTTPVMLARLAIYTRVYFDSSEEPEPINAVVQMPSGEKHELGVADTALVRDAFNTAKSNNAPLAGVVLKGIFSPLPLPSFGAISAIVRIGAREHVLGTLNVVIDPAASVSLPQT